MTRSGVAQLWFADQTQAEVLPDGEVLVTSATGDAGRFQQLFNDIETPEQSVHTDPESDNGDERSFGP